MDGWMDGCPGARMDGTWDGRSLASSRNLSQLQEAKASPTSERRRLLDVVLERA